MSRSISARIFSGFLVVTLGFAGVMGYTVYRMHRVRQDLELINKSYLRLTLILGEFYTIQGSLLNIIAERSAGRASSTFLRRQVELARRYRLRDVRLASELVKRARALGPGQSDRQFLEQTERKLAELLKAFTENEMLFSGLFGKKQTPPPKLREAGEVLLRSERKLEGMTRRMRNRLRGQVKKAAVAVEADQRYGIMAGLALVLLAILVSLVVTFRARRTLKPLQTLVQGTKRIGAGDYAGRVDVVSSDELGVLASEFNNMAAAVQEREAKLIRSERMAAAGLLASHITHEVRNPLNSISLNTEMLEEELGSAQESQAAEESRALCRAIRQEVDRLTDITEEYLRFARLPKLVLEAEQVNELLGNLLDFLSGEMKEQSVTVKRNLGDGIPPIQVDENQLRQAFLNLMRNAGEAMAEKGGTLTVETKLTGGVVEVRIADSGSGIDADDFDQVFEPFFSTKDHGTGLGLALTHQIIVEHGGEIGVESTKGEGTAFTVRLPVPLAAR